MTEICNSAFYNFDPNDVEPCPPTLNGALSGTTNIKLTWSFSTQSGCGKPTSITVRVLNPISGVWADITTLAGTATTHTFAFGVWADNDGWVKMGIIGKNDKGSTSKLIHYNWKTKVWVKF